MTLLLGVSLLDATQRRVNNPIIAAVGLLAFSARLAHPHVASLSAGILGASVALGLLVPLYALGLVGAADAKVFAAYGAVVGIGQLAALVFLSSLTAGLLSVVYMGAWQLSARTSAPALMAMQESANANALARGRRAGKTLPLAVALSLGVLATLRGDVLWQL